VINFIIIGGGWRAEFYLRIAKFLPKEFHVSAICVRNHERSKYISENFDVKVLSTVEETLKEPFDFIVNCINKDDICDLSVELADKGYYVLAETPVLKAPAENHSYNKIQIAEQFHLKGTFVALKKIIASGIIGDIGHINISIAHDYHAMSLIRFLLDDYDEPELLGDILLTDTMLETNGRIGELENKEVIDTTQKIRIYKFKNATAIYDYNIQQYFSPIRQDRLLIRGTRGEIDGNSVRYFNKDNKYVCGEIKHLTSGLLDGFYNDKIVFEDKTLYEWENKYARLSEEESAICECLVGMSNFVKTGKSMYDYEKAYKDYAFSMDIKKRG